MARARSGQALEQTAVGREEERSLSIRLKIEDTRRGFVATISERDDDGKVVGHPARFIVATKEEAKERVKAAARGLGLKTYGFVDKTSTRKPTGFTPLDASRAAPE